MTASPCLYDQLILISLDTLRHDVIQSVYPKLWQEKYGLEFEPATASLDAIAERGACFTNCIVAAPYTSASHASFFSGRWPLRHGVFEFFNRKLVARTIFSWARQAGYQTLFKTDFPIILGSYLGFDRDVDVLIEEADDEFLAQITPDRRLVAFVHFGGLHLPYGFHNLRHGGDAYRETVAALERGIPAEPSGSLADRLVESYRTPEDLDLLLRYKRVVQYLYAHREYRRLFELYLRGADFFFRRRFDPFWSQLESRLSPNALVVLFGDHGEEYDEHSYGHHNSVSHGVVQVPLIFYGRGVRAARYVQRMRSVDLAPTLIDLLGLPAHLKRHLDGASLAATVRGRESYPERTALVQAYTSDTAEFVAFQRRLLRDRRKSGALRHVLYKEAVYEGDFKLSRQYYEYADHGGISRLTKRPARANLERWRDGGGWRGFENRDVHAQLAGILDAHNRSRRHGRRLEHVRREVRQHLENMGYRV